MSLQENLQEDHVMSPPEENLMKIEIVEAQIRDALKVMKEKGILDMYGLEKHLSDIVISRKISEYLLSFTNPEEQLQAVERMVKEGPPLEILAPDGAFVTEGPQTIQ